MKSLKLFRIIAAGCALATGVCALAQNNAYWWTRTDASLDIEQNTVRHALVNGLNQLVAVGRCPSPTGYQGCLTIFNRNRAVIAVKKFSPQASGDLELTRLFLYSDGYLVAGTFTPTGSTDQKVYMGLTDQNLNLLDEIVFTANNGPGEEVVTDLVGTGGHRWVCGRAMADNGWRSFAYHLTGLLDNPVLLDNSPLGDDPNPQISYEVQGPGNATLVYAFTSNTGPRVHQYNLFNVQLWNRSLAQTGGSGYKMILDNVGLGANQNPVVTLSWNDEPTPGNPQSHAKIYVLSYLSGNDFQTTNTASVDGANMLGATGAMISTNSLNALYDAGNRSVVQSFSSLSMTPLNTWTSAFLPGQSRSLTIDAFGELLAVRTIGSSIYAAKLNTSLVKRFDLLRLTNLNADFMTAGAALSSSTGDIFLYGSDQHHMAIIAYQQAPIAVTDHYVARRNVFFRPTESVLANDRYAVGTSISVTFAPLHGTFSMGADGIFNYRSDPSFTGYDSFRYTLTRTGFPPTFATVNIQVTN